MSSGVHKTSDFATLLDQAMQAHRAGDDRARTLLSAAWSAIGHRADEMFAMAQAFHTVGDTNGLRDVESAVARMDHKRPRVSLTHGRVLRMLGEYPSAVPLLSRAAQLGPEIVDTHIALTAVYLETGDAGAAVAAGRAGLAIHPKNVLLRQNTLRAQIALDIDQVDLAELDGLIADGPKREASHRLRLTVLRQLRRIDEGHRAVEAFAAACPTALDADLEHATLDMLGGRPREVLARLAPCLEEDTPDPARLAQLGLAYATLANTEAVDQVLARLDALPPTADRLTITARLRLMMRQLEPALDDFERSLSKGPDQPVVFAQILKTLLTLGRAAEALDRFNAAPEALRTQADVIVRAAEAAKLTGQLDTAVQMMEAAAQPSNPEVIQYLTEILCYDGRSDAARTRLEGWTPEMRRDRASRALALAHTHVVEYDYPKVAEYVEQALEADPNRASALWQLAHAKVLMCDAEGAMAAWRRMLAINKGLGHRTRSVQGGLLSNKANELLLDPQGTAELRQAWSDGPDVLRDVAATAILNGVDLIGPAQSLLIALRRMGAFRSAPAGQSPIPNAVHQYWEGPIPPDLAAALATMKQLNPREHYTLWSRAEARAYVADHASAATLRAFDLSRHAAERADLFRLVLLFNEGGIYVDADDLCRGPLRDLVPTGAKTVVFQEYHGAIANNFLATVPGNGVLAEALDSAVEETIAGGGSSIWMRTGPGVYTRSLAKAIARNGSKPLSGTHILKQTDMSRCLVICAPFSYKLDNRHWMKMEEGG